MNEPWGPEDHWVNNPLISAASKVAFFEEEIARAEKATEERIIKLLEDNYPGRLAGVIALIKGENK